MRWPLIAWNTLFLEKGAYQYKSDRSSEWNRGAYLVQGAAHCGSCHTPRGLGMQEKAYDESQKGFLAGAKIGGWEAFNITSNTASGIGSWSQPEIVQYLKTGNVPFKAQAAGSMAEAVTHSFSKMDDADLQAIALYLRDIPSVGDNQTRPRSSKIQPIENNDPTGANVYLNNCASCHGKEDRQAVPMLKCVQCHNTEKLAAKTADVKPVNPHNNRHFATETDCAKCHHVHQKSENLCISCHPRFDLVTP